MQEFFTWIPLYKELAAALLRYRIDRSELVSWIYDDLGQITRTDGGSLVAYLHEKNGDNIKDIDPFSVYAIFNRNLRLENRTELLQKFKEHLGLASEVPTDFNGIPTLDARRAFFFSWNDDNAKVIQDQWTLFEKVVNNEDIEEAFNQVLDNKMPKYSLTMALYWIAPERFLSLDSRNRDYLKAIGLQSDYNKLRYNTYMETIERVKQVMEERNLPCNSFVELSYMAWKATASTDSKKYWLAGYTFSDEESQFERFVSNGIWEGRFRDDNKTDQKTLTLAKSISEGDVIILKSTSTKGKNHDLPFMRIKAVGVVTSNVSTSRIEGATICNCSVEYINTEEKDFNGAVYGSFRKTIHQANSKINDVIDYVNSLINKGTMQQQKYKKYIELLQETHNLVLTGAPGTGKTYMAQEIAKEMAAVTRFVQFHPSYDYTDFVEGLRPIEKVDGQMGFERKDGVFKEFCREAIKNLIDSEKSVESLTKEMSWQEKLDRFVEDAIEDETKFKTVNGSEFVISEMRSHTIVIHNEQNEKTTQVAVNADEILELLTNEVPLNIVRDIRYYFNRKYGTQPDSYAFVITKAVRTMKQKMPIVEANKIDRKPFVFIIDEINRGEASKVFGELFYAIDPGYRGKKEHLVQTQYQNLVPETDVFAKGFYVPENVYILATMNDIDRSVESMDFAMRRRFTWIEITPDDTDGMLDTLPCADEAKATMKRLNKAIADTDGLGAAYMVGPAYFLKLKDDGADLDKLWKMNIKPLLKEYLRGSRNAAEDLGKFKKAYFNTVTPETNETPEQKDED